MYAVSLYIADDDFVVTLVAVLYIAKLHTSENAKRQLIGL